jgi:hypothetical protein
MVKENDGDRLEFRLRGALTREGRGGGKIETQLSGGESD